MLQVISFVGKFHLKQKGAKKKNIFNSAEVHICCQKSQITVVASQDPSQLENVSNASVTDDDHSIAWHLLFLLFCDHLLESFR